MNLKRPGHPQATGPQYSTRRGLPAGFATATAAAIAVAAAAAAATAAKGRLRTGFIHREGTATHRLLMKRFDGLLGIGVRRHFDEPEAARATRGVIADDGDGVDRASLAENLAKIVFGGGVGEIADVQFATHGTDS